MYHNELIEALVESNDQFIKKFKTFLFTKNLTIIDFSKKTKIPQSTIYKILSNPSKDFRISTFREIIKAVKSIEKITSINPTIGIITTRGALEYINRAFTIDQRTYEIKEYPATTIEEEIIQGIRAEREGIKGIICGPVAATTLEKVVNIPVISLRFERNLLIAALRNLANKIN